MDAVDTYLSTCAEFQRQAPGREPGWLGELRQRAVARFAELGFPSNRLEDWRFTNVAPIVSLRFRPAPRQRLSAASLDAFAPANLHGPRLVLVDGAFSAELSSLASLPPGVQLSGLLATLAAGPDGIATHLGQVAGLAPNGFVALNTAFLHDAAIVRLAPGTVVAEPIQVLCVSTGPSEPTMSHPRVLILAGSASQASVLETHVSLANGPHLTNAVTEIVTAEEAVIEHVTVALESASVSHFGTLAVHQARASRVAAHSYALTRGLVRNDVRVDLDGEGSESLLYGLFVGDGRAHIDNHTTIDHQQARSSSQELYKGILGGHATGVFNGRIRVRPAAQKTNARQTNRNLLLSPDAQINTNPQLEILADDVKCSHGSTIGQLDADALFYLRARGIDPHTARTMLTYAFANEMLDRLRNPWLRGHLAGLVSAQLQATTSAEVRS